MPASDAIVVGEDWISEHYFTTDATKQSFQARVRIDTPVEWEYYRHGGILPMVLRRLASGSAQA